MSMLICPVCLLPLAAEEKRFVCEKGHSFDRAAAGYVNLFLNQGSSAKRHGDDKAMIRARTAFLSTGAYAPLSDKLVAASLPLLEEGSLFADAGCGEGHYTALLADALAKEGKNARLVGVDLSKEAVSAAAKRKKEITFAVASVFHLPFAAESVRLLWNIFAPLAEEEYLRVLEKGGYLLRVFPLAEHLMGLKAAVYEKTYENAPKEPACEGMRLLWREELRFDLSLKKSEEIMALFSMTPYYYKTSAADQEKLARLTSLTTPVAFGIELYQKD